MGRGSMLTPRYLARRTNNLSALSMSRSVREYLQVPREGTILATFRRSCYLDLEGRIIALVAAELHNGPLNIVLKVPVTHSFQGLSAGRAVTASPTGMTLTANLYVGFQAAQTWTATLPPWTRMAEGRLSANLALARTLLVRGAPNGSFAHDLPAAHRGTRANIDEALHLKANRALALLADGIRRRDLTTLTEGTRQLAGLGFGLTPSGDDVLVGTLLALAVSRPGDAEIIRTVIVAAAAGRSPRISGVYLQAAARGEASETWHRLLALMPDGHPSALISAIRTAMAVGETSGADMLAGFLLAQEALNSWEDLADDLTVQGVGNRGLSF